MKKYLLSILVSLSFFPLSARPFNGNVYYRKPGGGTEPLPFAQVYYLEKAVLIDADENGKFSVSTDFPATLVATYVGYTRDTVIVVAGMESGDFFLTGENGIEESTVTARQDGLSKLKSIKTEVITSAGICKMACCALAESFENSASVSVGYSDAVTGARQIKLLGLSGTYTQMLDENRPVMRGLASPFGLQYIPGQWLESIQIAKGPSSVTNGMEAITGQINVEHRKPTDEIPLFIQVYGSSDSMYEANVASSIQFNEKWNVVNLAHIGGSSANMDHNGDSFRDEPEDMQIDFSSRWLYYHPQSGLQIRFGASLVNDDRLGGQTPFTKDTDRINSNLWGSRIRNKGLDGYVKIGIPLNEEQTSSIAAIADVSHYETDSYFGRNDFTGSQNNLFLNVIYQNELNDIHKIVTGVTFQKDNINQVLKVHQEGGSPMPIDERRTSIFGEYTYTPNEKLTFVGGVSFENNSLHGWLFTPRANLKYSLTDNIDIRAIGGKGYRTANLFTDNIGVLSTGRRFDIDDNLDLLEGAWTYGGNITFYLPFGSEDGSNFLSFDYFHNDFKNQVIADQEIGDFKNVCFYNLDGKAFSNTYQMDFSIDPVERFNITLTLRHTDSKVTLKEKGLVERPMTSRFKGVLNMQYATPMNIWTFDFTAQINGSMRLPEFAAMEWNMKESPVYPMLYAQITRKFRGFDVYVGGENLTGYRQKDAIISADDPFSDRFNASCIWGPLMGTKIYAGLRFTLWK